MERKYRQFGARFQDSFERSGCSVSTSKHSLEDLIGMLKKKRLVLQVLVASQDRPGREEQITKQKQQNDQTELLVVCQVDNQLCCTGG